MISAAEALERLKTGNHRFVTKQPLTRDVRHEDFSEGQAPFAVILGCSDSRVPIETVFDQGLGDLFVIRVAGNVVTPEVIGSAEFAAHYLGTRLIVVLGHSGCGAVQATLAALGPDADLPSANLHAIVERIRPAVAPLHADADNDPQALMEEAVRANVHTSVTGLFEQSGLLKRLSEQDGLRIEGAVYDLATGRVNFSRDDL